VDYRHFKHNHSYRIAIAVILIVMCFLYKGLSEDTRNYKTRIAKELENYEEIVSELLKKKK
jgi:hypothetical protein